MKRFCMLLIFALTLGSIPLGSEAQASDPFAIPDLAYYLGAEISEPVAAYDYGRRIKNPEAIPMEALRSYVALLERNYDMVMVYGDPMEDSDEHEWELQLRGDSEAFINILFTDGQHILYYIEGDLVAAQLEVWKGNAGQTSDPSVLPDFLKLDTSGEFVYETDSLASLIVFFAKGSFDLRYVAEDYVQALIDMGYKVTDTETKKTRSFDIFRWYLSHPDVDGALVNRKGQVCIKYQLSDLSGCEGTYLSIEHGSGITYGGDIIKNTHDNRSDSDDWCSACDGTGKCSHCKGTGQKKRLQPGTSTWLTQDCTSCTQGKCSFCNGRGY